MGRHRTQKQDRVAHDGEIDRHAFAPQFVEVTHPDDAIEDCDAEERAENIR